MSWSKRFEVLSNWFRALQRFSANACTADRWIFAGYRSLCNALCKSVHSPVKPASPLLKAWIAFGIIVFALSAQSTHVHSLDFPYVANVDYLTCGAAVADNKCKSSVISPAIVARQSVSGCGYFEGKEGPLKNRWFEKCDPIFTSGYAKVCITNRDNAMTCGLVDEELNIIIPLVYDDLRLVENVAMVAVNYRNKWGYFSLNDNRLLFSPQFSYVSDFSEGMAYVIDADEQITEPAWLIDDKGLRVASVERNIKVSGHFSNGLIPAEIDFRWGYLDNKGGWAIAPQFFAAESFTGGLAAVQYGADPDNWAMINGKGEGLIFFEGASHHLTLADRTMATLSIGCEPADSNKLVSEPPVSSGASIDSADNKLCYRICFDPLQKVLNSYCDIDRE